MHLYRHPTRLVGHPALRAAAGESARLIALIALYVILLGLFALAALGVWTELPSAILDSWLIPLPSPGDGAEPVKLRGAL